MKIRSLMLALLAAIPAVASATEIRFEDAYTANWQDIANNYGSVAGQLDVSYFDVERQLDHLRFWTGSYSGRPAAFAGNTDAGSSAVITLTPTAGHSVRLDSFFLGAWPNTTRATSYYIDDLATAGIDFSSGAISVGPGGLVVSPALTSATGLVIGFGPSAYNVGINNIAFTINPVPEPDSYALLLAGLGVMGAVMRRRSPRKPS